MDSIKTTYRGIEISYDEGDDKWHFTLRDKDRSAETLANAKKAIDAPVREGKKPFSRFKAWRKRYNRDEFELVTVTSIANNRYGGQKLWVTGPHGDREQEYPGSLYEISDHNEQLLAQSKVKRDELNNLHAEIQKIEGQMKRITFKADDHD